MPGTCEYDLIWEKKVFASVIKDIDVKPSLILCGS